MPTPEVADTINAADTVAKTAAPPPAELQRDVIGLLGAVTLGVVFRSPTMTLYGLFGPIFLAAGKAAPLAFIFALVATLPTAYGYAVLSRDHPTSGSAADWSARATTPRPEPGRPALAGAGADGAGPSSSSRRGWSTRGRTRRWRCCSCR